MIMGFKQIGEILGFQSWEAVLKKPKGSTIIRVNFDIGRKELDLSSEKYSDGKEREYKLVNVKLTGKQNQPFLTFEDEKRLFGEKGKPHAVWLSIMDECKKLKIDIPQEIEKVGEIFYDEYTTLKEEFKEKVKGYLKENGIKDRDIAFYTVLVNGEVLVEKEFYTELLNKKVLEEVLEQGQAVCSVCGNPVSEYITEFTRFPFKFFINDKVGYSQGLSDRWEGNFVTCKECYMHILGGMNYVNDHLSDRLSVLEYMIVPEMIGKNDLDRKDLEVISDLIKERFNPFKFAEDVKEVKEELKLIAIPFNLNYIFYSRNQSQLNVYGIIEDIPRGEVERVIESVKELGNNFRELLDERSVIKTVGDIFWLIPLREVKRNNRKELLGVPKLISVFSAVFNREKVDLGTLIYDFVRCISAKYYGSQIFHNVREEDDIDIDYVLKTNQLLVLLGKKGGEYMERLQGPYSDYIKRANFNNQEAALFLLGVVIARIGYNQYKKYNHKPILNKMNFQGIGIHRLKQLYNEVYEKIHQLELNYPDNETIYATSIEMFNEESSKWKLTPYENVYYLLSGYAFETKLIINRSKGGEV